MNIYAWILENLPIYFLIVLGVPLLASLFGLNSVPFAQYLLIAIVAVPPIAKWWQESVDRLKENKPLAFSERIGDGYEVRNVGGGLATNVWYFASQNALGVPLGSLAKGESRSFSTPPSERHLLVAESRPGSGRKWTPTMNVLTNDVVCHGFVELDDASREGTLTEFLGDEATKLGQLWHWQLRH